MKQTQRKKKEELVLRKEGEEVRRRRRKEENLHPRSFEAFKSEVGGRWDSKDGCMMMMMMMIDEWEDDVGR